MSKKIQKHGLSGKFGVRYGSSLRKKFYNLAKYRINFYRCISCSKLKIKRIQSGIWKCLSCHSYYTSGSCMYVQHLSVRIV
mmetsp:Transcript_1044/g.1794  ORF Transcript_1044/g.1794 Transcript_1044/m.1794 type:complete len:81 (-) Transcript_1044:519-761(-)